MGAHNEYKQTGSYHTLVKTKTKKLFILYKNTWLKQ